MKRLIVTGLAALCLVGAALAQQRLGESAKRVLGTWEFSNAERDKTCTVDFKSDTVPRGFKLEFDPNCANLFPLVSDVVAWAYPDNDLLHLLDAQGKALVDFSEVEDGIFEAPTPGVGVLFLQNPADTGPPPKPPEQLAGDWAIMRGADSKPLCELTLTPDAAPDGLAVKVKPGCDPAIARLNLSLWRIDSDELMLIPARGAAWRFEEVDGNSWRRIPAGANPITLVRR